jgi:hypothetical protein
MFKLTANQLWKSELRARDVQLILRVSRIMPNWRQAQKSTLDDVGRVEVAKYILGSGGMDVDQLEDMEEMFGGGSAEDGDIAAATKIELTAVGMGKTEEERDHDDAVSATKNTTTKRGGGGGLETRKTASAATAKANEEAVASSSIQASISLKAGSLRSMGGVRTRHMPRRRRMSLDAARLRVQQSGRLPTLAMYNSLVGGKPQKKKENNSVVVLSRNGEKTEGGEEVEDTVVF